MNLTKIFAFSLLGLSAFSCDNSSKSDLSWPEINRETKPWTRWWWEGSAVTKAGITAELEAFKKVGLGGVEITPIYEVYGHENDAITYLSPQWMDMLEHTLKEADRLGLGVDMATGTGWPFGGPWVSDEDACMDMNHKVYLLKGGESINEPIAYHQEPYVRSVGMQIYETLGIYKTEGRTSAGSIKEPLIRNDKKPILIKDLVEPVSANKNLQSLALDQVKFDKQLRPVTIMAYSANGERINLIGKLEKNNRLNWVAPAGDWAVYAVFPGWHGKMVERAAPGGEGNVIDHFSKRALQHYLGKFDSSFKGREIKSLRAFFNDSYEVDDARGTADWTPHLFEEFKKRRKYDLRDQLPALFGKDDPEKNERVLCDYRETIAELIYDNFTSVWKAWAHSRDKIVRNQAHGSPSNILDLYALVDIPEMEGAEVSRIKMASSAANVSGKKLTSSESATWLNEHFLSNLADIKQSVDRFLISGVNHVFYHGTCYSPQDEPWPGWLFYAAVHLNDRNPMWNDFGKLNEYVTRSQSLLQKATPDNEVLVYLPIYDRYSTPGAEMIEHFDGVDKPFDGTAFKESIDEMLEGGVAFDYISDKQLRELIVGTDGVRSSPVSTYKTILLPACRYIPMATFKALKKLVTDGATILIYKDFPESISGFMDCVAMKAEYTSAVNEISFARVGGGVEEAHFGKGRFLRSDDLSRLMEQAGVRREPLVDIGLQFVRKKTENGTLYFISNWTGKRIEDWVTLSRPGKSAVLFDPMFGQIGLARTRTSQNDLQIFLKLERGESVIVQLFGTNVQANPYNYAETSGEGMVLNEKWQLTFLRGGPSLPAPIELDSLSLWTNIQIDELKKFSGTGRYHTSFQKPKSGVVGWVLDLGVVNETAKVYLNGDSIATLIGPVYKIFVDDRLLKESNVLDVEVSNFMANRIADLDKRGVVWKKFYNVNFPARLAENRKNGIFDASSWNAKASGLKGPVTITPVNP
ncbi:MAG TPA: glycosyl hydrolase [Cyclobacteriaceae bacterium]|nr:glycosyl hydrolase [Cyclobacteriaceae bacterium]